MLGHDMRLVRERAAELIAELDAFCIDPFENPDNALAHEKITAPEFWRQCNGELDAVVAFAGSGSALAGLARGLLLFKPNLRAYVVEPSVATSLANGCGFEASQKLSQLRDVRIDGHLICSDNDATAKARALALHEGVLAGYSTGAQLHAAAELLQGPERGNTIGFLVCDTGMKYLSTSLYS